MWLSVCLWHPCTPLPSHILLMARWVDYHTGQQVVRCETNSTHVSVFLQAHLEGRSYYDMSVPWSHSWSMDICYDEQSPSCAQCGTPPILKHILVKCPSYDDSCHLSNSWAQYRIFSEMTMRVWLISFYWLTFLQCNTCLCPSEFVNTVEVKTFVTIVKLSPVFSVALFCSQFYPIISLYQLQFICSI
jgi:hypothetical protein